MLLGGIAPQMASICGETRLALVPPAWANSTSFDSDEELAATVGMVFIANA
jgi:hypothetical protein